MGDKYKSKGLLVAIIGLVVAITGSAGLVLATNKRGAQDSALKVSVTVPAEQSKFTYLKYQGQDGKTALTILKTKADVVTKDSSYGTYVDSINGVKGGDSGKYWALYVNGSPAQVGADAYTTKTGESIEWKFE